MSTEHFRKALEIAKNRQSQPQQKHYNTNLKIKQDVHSHKHKHNAIDSLDIHYKYTRIQQTSDTILRNNRLIAGFHDDPRSTPFRILRTQVQQALNDNNWNTIAITAPHSRAGKSFVSANLAISLSLISNQTVLLVDLDLRSPSLHKYFGLNIEYGIYDYLVNDVPLNKVFINPGMKRLVLLPGSTPTSSSSELLATHKSMELLNEIKTRYSNRIIIFDLPPLIGIDDALVVLPKIESSLLVIEANRTTIDDVTKSMKILKDHQMIGTVFNKADDAEIIQYGY